jgi:uncharacterized phiE125 gp8 family phage protein
VRAILGVAAVDEAGAAAELAPEAFTAEIDTGGEGWVRLRGAVVGRRLRVSYRAGLAADWNGVPEMLRHGIIRLAAAYYLRRGEPDEAEMPAAVTALWRPWRRLRCG